MTAVSTAPDRLSHRTEMGTERDGARVLRCPQCGGEDIARSRTRTLWERLMKTLLRIRAYRCLDCRARFFGRRRKGLGRPYG